MDAAERIFSGEYDDVTDADEVAPEEVKPANRRVATACPPRRTSVMKTTFVQRKPRPAKEKMRDVAHHKAEMDYYDDDEEFLDLNLKRSGEEIDPYPCIFFSRGCRQEVTEIEETPERVTLYSTPSTSHVRPLMTQGEWMKGFPEGNEQGLLFGLWTNLQAPSAKCPNQGDASLARENGMFTAIWGDFGQYVSSLCTHGQQQYPSCSVDVCLACGGLLKFPKERLSTKARLVLVNYSEVIVIQAQAALKGWESSKKQPDLKTELREAEKRKIDDEIRVPYKDWANRIKFHYCDLSVEGENSNDSPSFKSVFSNDAQGLVGTGLFKRSLALAQGDGKVCLSLLGTWQGPGWNSGKSILLHALISIRSMILCDELSLNEPGWEGQRLLPRLNNVFIRWSRPNPT
ncbi:hypothetical protein CALVIDRAFT_568673 [Calocera viscosa TUFC12733]|uniref:Uncharacterized protein n=1 Tax=Calocera viscosa (strain TUFC12733) TaxID=1330018 RepID=A0A167GTF3_CALVF|nr:hypothetical protein CALVIDRAFT_568673 [Calocera viscosa TUFC12733]